MRRSLKASVLLFTLLFTAAAVASQSTTDASSPTQGDPGSTVSSPAQLVYSPKVDLTNELAHGIPNSAEITLNVSVDPNGQARNVQVLDSDDPALNGPVMAAVRKYRFLPATTDNQAVASDVTLFVRVQR